MRAFTRWRYRVSKITQGMIVMPSEKEKKKMMSKHIRERYLKMSLKLGVRFSDELLSQKHKLIYYSSI